MKTHVLMASACALVLASCSAVGPDYAAPSIDLSSSFVGARGVPVADVSQVQWWRSLNDDHLDTLVARGLSQNLDIQTGVERIRQAEAQLAATGGVSQASGNLTGQTVRSGGDLVESRTTSSASLNVGYVFDLFGRFFRGQEQAAANLDAARYDLGTVRLAYLSGIVGNYVDARYYQETLQLTRQTINSTAQTVSLVQSQRELGAATDLAVAQAQAELDTARASLPPLEANFQASVFRIATLLAEPAGPLLEQMSRGAAQPYASGHPDVGVPANLLRNRPDIVAAERRFAAAVAAVGIAEAELYPSLNLSGNVTIASADSWSFGPTISLPVLGRGVFVARREAAVSVARQAELEWRATVLAAVEEVQVAQSAYLRRQREVATLRNAVASNVRALELSRFSFEAGGATVLDLLDAERGASNARISLALAVRETATAWVRLQIATGSGWATGAPMPQNVGLN